jgi:iron complex transport system substrate-binding protein
MNKILSTLVFFSVLFVSCNSDVSKQKKKNISEKEIVLKYAKHFKVYKSGDVYRIEILNKDKVKHEYRVSNNPHSSDIMKIPFTKFVATSSTHLGYIEYLDSREGLLGFPSTNFIADSILHARVLSGDVAELGTAESMNFEKLFQLNPDVIFDFPNPISEGQKSKLAKAGMKMFVITEFYEETALGKVEWIKLFGLLLGKEELANKVFEDIENKYLNIKESIEVSDDAPSVFSGIMFGDTWYAPGGKSFAAKFYKAAGVNYVWASDSSSGSRSFSFEKVYNDAVDADYWIGVGGQSSLNSMIESNSNYKLFKAFKNKNVYSLYGGQTEWGANSFFEKGVLQPEVILQDLLLIFDDNADKSKLVYHKKLN